MQGLAAEDTCDKFWSQQNKTSVNMCTAGAVYTVSDCTDVHCSLYSCANQIVNSQSVSSEQTGRC